MPRGCHNRCVRRQSGRAVDGATASFHAISISISGAKSIAYTGTIGVHDFRLGGRDRADDRPVS